MRCNTNTPHISTPIQCTKQENQKPTNIRHQTLLPRLKDPPNLTQSRQIAIRTASAHGARDDCFDLEILRAGGAGGRLGIVLDVAGLRYGRVVGVTAGRVEVLGYCAHCGCGGCGWMGGRWVLIL